MMHINVKEENQMVKCNEKPSILSIQDTSHQNRPLGNAHGSCQDKN